MWCHQLMEGWIGEGETSKKWNLEKREKRTFKHIMNKKMISIKTVLVIVKLNTSSENLSQQSELWLAGVWGLMMQLGQGGGGRGWGRWSASVLYHQPVPHLFNGSLICDYGHQLETKDGQAYFRLNKKQCSDDYFTTLSQLWRINVCTWS